MSILPEEYSDGIFTYRRRKSKVRILNIISDVLLTTLWISMGILFIMIAIMFPICNCFNFDVFFIFSKGVIFLGGLYITIYMGAIPLIQTLFYDEVDEDDE